MTLEEVKKEALKLMFTNQDNEIDSSDISELEADDNYSDYLNNMYGSINRAIVRLRSKGVEYKAPRLTTATSNTFDFTWEEQDENGELIKIGLDINLCELLPYFIKGELYEEDNPSIATIAKNYFEDAVDDYLSTKVNTRVELAIEMEV